MEWLSIAQAAELAGTHQSTMYRKVQDVRGTGVVRKMGRRIEVSRTWVIANSRESPRKTVRKSKGNPQGPQDAPTAAQTAPSPPPAPAYPPDYVARLEARIDALEAERREDKERADAERMRWHATLNGLTDTIRELEARTSDLVALNARLGMARHEAHRPRLEAVEVEYQAARQGEAPAAAADPEDEPRADLVAWLKAVQAAKA